MTTDHAAEAARLLEGADQANLEVDIILRAQTHALLALNDTLQGIAEFGIDRARR